MKIELEVTQDQLHVLIQHAEDESEYWNTYGNIDESRAWQKVREKLAGYLKDKEG